MPLAEVSQLAAGAGAPIHARRRSSGGSWADLAFGPWPKDDDFLVPDSVRAEQNRRAQRARRWAATAAAATGALLAVGALLHAALPQPAGPPLAGLPPTQQQQNFLMLFSGHQGSSAVEDIIASWDGVFVPGFEPLEIDAVSAAQKLAFMDAVWRVPRAPAEFPAWRDALLPVPGMRVNPTAIRDFAAVEARDYRFAGFKLRPYAADGGSHGGSGFVDFLAAFLDDDDDEGGHLRGGGLLNTRPGMTGLDPEALKAALDRHNVTVVLTHRANALKEALSWYRARERGVSQFHREHAAAPVHVDLSTFLHWLRYVEQTNRALRTASAYFGRPTVPVLYEDFARDPREALEPLMVAWGLDPAAQPVATHFVKTGSDDLRSMVTNFEELCAHFKGSPYWPQLGVEACAPPGPAARPVELDGEASVLKEPSRPTEAEEEEAAARPMGPEDWIPKSLDLSEDELLKTQAAAAVTAEANEALAATGIAEELGTSGGLVADVLAGLEADAGREEAARAVEGRLFDALSGFQLEPRGGCALEAFDAEWSPEAAGSAACAARVFDRKIRTMAAYRDAVHAGGEAGRGVVLFKHVHKAAGTSLCHHLRDHAGLRTEERPLPQHPTWDTDCVPQEAFRNRPAGAPDLAARTRTLRPADVPFGEAGVSAEMPAGFAGNSSAALGNATAAPWLGGNCWWGHLGPELQAAVPELFPGLQLVASEGPMPDAVHADGGFPMVTMLRAPVERTVSAYRWWELLHAEFPGINPGNCGAFDARNATTFDEWLAAYPSDWMTRELLGQAWLQDPERAIDDRAFAFAVARLELFHGVLISEHFDRSVELLERLLGLDAAGEAVPRLVSAHHADELPAPQREAVRRKNEWDLRLYDRALALFREQLEKAGLDAPQQ